MFSEISHEEAREIFENGWETYLNGGHGVKDNLHHDPDKNYSRERQDKKAVWRRGYRFAREINNS